VSSAATRIRSQDAAATAKRFLALIDGTTERIAVAGSLRRRLPMCGDVEVVAIPKITEVETTTPDLFGDHVEWTQTDCLHERLTELLAAGTIQKRPLGEDGTSTKFGPRTKYLLFEDRPIDVFTTDPEIWGWTMVLRTGPAEFSRQIVQGREFKTSDRRRGLLPPHMSVQGGLRSRLSGELIPTPEESDVFAALGIEYRDPWLRR
jgi:DNA polymerase/3'-5' exonuclease PolX